MAVTVIGNKLQVEVLADESTKTQLNELEVNKVDKVDVVDNLTTDDATKVLSAKQGKVLQDTKEDLANKATDFTVVDDTKYPTTKAVSERLLNLPIAELNNHTLREVFEESNVFSTPRLVELKRNSNRADIYNISITANNHYYYLINVIETTLTKQAFTRIELTPENNIEFSTIGYHSIIDIKNNNASLIYSFIATTEIDSDDYYINFYQTALINLDSLGISHLTVEQMDYWFSVYQALLVSDTNAIFSMFASKTLEAWITPTLTGATSTYIRYRKDTLGSVIIEGNITVTTAGTNFTLPTGYRPLFDYTVGNLTFNTDGAVVSSATGTQTLSIRFTGGA